MTFSLLPTLIVVPSSHMLNDLLPHIVWGNDEEFFDLERTFSSVCEIRKYWWAI